MTSDQACSGSGVLLVEPNGISAPPLAISFGKTSGSHLLAVADEEGFVSIFNTCRQLPSFINSHDKTGDVQTELWLAHSNAIFDVCWVRDDKNLLTASGDQTVRLWDIEARSGLGVMKGHSGSVKSLCGHPSQPDIFVSGSRDGSVALWDVRSSSTRNSSNERCFVPVSVIKDAHISSQSKKVRGSKSITRSVTAVLYLKEDRIIATVGAADGVVKFWDTRNLKQPAAQSPAQTLPSGEGKEGRVHGIAGLSQDPSGKHLIASCTDSRVYVYDVLGLERGSLKSFSGHILGSFYIKAAFSPDGTHILSGSTDGNVFIWQMDKPEAPPVILKGHGGEVTAVDWCPTDFCKIATCSDDFTVRIWSNLEPQFEPIHSSPSAIRRRISADPVSNLLNEFRRSSLDKDCQLPACNGSPSYDIASKAISYDSKDCTATKTDYFRKASHEEKCPAQEKIGSPGASARSDQGFSKFLGAIDAQSYSNHAEKSPEPTNSPSSVLNPPCSVRRRRTIIDYYKTM